MTSKLRWDLLSSAVLASAVIFPLAAHAAADSTSPPEVVVTAQKRTQKLQDVPLQISVLSGGDLERMQSTQLIDWAGYVPGLAITSNGAPGETTIALDGIGPIGSASEVGIYLNDTPIGSSSSFQGGNGLAIDLMPYDLDRVEVLHGPQGTLYGASTMGGLIKYDLASPNLTQFSGRMGGDLFGVQNGGGAGGGLRGAVNIPIIDDKLAIRASVYDQATPGFIDNATTGKKGDNALNQGGGRIAALWKATPDVSIALSALYQRSHADSQSIVALEQTTGRPFGGSLSNINTRSEPYTQELQLYDATVNWNLHWANLTSVSSYQRFKNSIMEDLTDYIGVYLGAFGGPGPGQSDFDERYRLEKFSQEVRLASPDGQALEWLVGGFYTHERGSNYEVFNAYDASGVREPALNPLEYVNLPSLYEEYALFGHATYHLTDRFEVPAGLRYAHNQQSFLQTAGGALLNPADPAGAVVTLPGKSSEGVTTYAISPSFHFTKHILVYARIASGYQPGGPNIVRSGETVPSQFNSSTLVDYQAGVKSTFLDGRATVDLSAFYIDWSKIQVGVTIGAESAIENAGAARSEGFDFNGTLSPLPGLTLGANLTYTDAVLTSDVASLGTVKGARLPGVPSWSGALTGEYAVALNDTWRGFAGGGWRYTGSEFSAPEGEIENGGPAGYPAKAYGVLDLHLGVRSKGWTLSLFAKNLTDRRAYLSASSYFNDAIGSPIDIKAPVLQPRTVGVSIDRSF